MIDEHDWSIIERNLALTPDQRLDKATKAANFVLEGRRAMRAAGFGGGWDDLHPGVVVAHLGGIPTAVAGLADVITSKAAADRPKDRAMLPLLRALLARQTRAARPQ